MKKKFPQCEAVLANEILPCPRKWPSLKVKYLCFRQSWRFPGSGLERQHSGGASCAAELLAAQGSGTEPGRRYRL